MSDETGKTDVSDERHRQRFKSGVRAAVTWLHKQARSMNDPKARDILNSAAFSLGININFHPRNVPEADPSIRFQARVDEWVRACFGDPIRDDKVERNHRFLEEALEVVQAAGCTQSEAHQLVEYVFARQPGEIEQEVGGAMNTLAALCNAHSVDMAEAGDVELARCWTVIEKIRAKQAAKPKHSPLPEHVDRVPGDGANDG